MKISMLVHNLNRAEAVKRGQSSMVNQAYRPFEVVIPESGSTDDSRNSYSASVSQTFLVPGSRPS